MSASNLVIVESPAKAKTINKYLGADYEVIASFGHVRDLVNKDGSVLPDEGFAMKWELGARSAKHVNDIKRLAKKSKAIYLATDPDREGEAISWHLKEILAESSLLDKVELHRVTFNEITKKAVQGAFDDARDIDTPLVDAYMARRALDYLVGFNISPVLWRKLPGSKSAGRVQSVALRLICERETEIELFKPQEYWSIETTLHTPNGAPFTARLTHLAGNKLGKLDINSEEMAKGAAARIESKDLHVTSINKKQVRRHPAPPFITSSLQMEASRKLGMSASNTMRNAQALYEAGLITYMRTDGTTLSGEAVAQARSLIEKDYGANYLPDAPRLYKSKAKNAQEAHEAIRPTDLSVHPRSSKAPKDEYHRKLYELIWKRTMATQMESAVMDQMAVDISDGTDDVILRANGSVVTFDGFLTLYQESTDADDGEGKKKKADDKDRRLPPMGEQDALKHINTLPEQHFTQPPPRYSEATLVKALEEQGIGRPSTYASIMQVLRDRNYVEMQQRRFVPQDRGRLVTTFLSRYFTRYVDYDFTATLEEELDAIASGDVNWKDALGIFWKNFKAAIDETTDLTITDVIDYLDAELGPHFLPVTEDNPQPRKCKACDDGKLGLRLGKFGAFIGCSNYPTCKFTRPLVVPEDGEDGGADDALANEPKELGVHPENGRSVSLRKGPYGPYVQIDPPPEDKDADAKYDQAIIDWTQAKKDAKAAGEKAPRKPPKPKKPKPKRQGLPKGVTVADVTLDMALSLLALPREVGTHPETGKLIEAGIGRFGPFLKHDGVFTSLPKDDDLMIIGMNRAVEVLAEGAIKRAAREAAKAEKAAKGEVKPKAKAKAKAKKKSPAKKKSAAKKKA